MLAPEQSVIYGDTEDLGGMHHVQGVVSAGEGWGWLGIVARLKNITTVLLWLRVT